jgi:hypothetical protein
VWFYFSILSAVFSVLFDSYVPLADDHVNNVSYFPFMSIKKSSIFVYWVKEILYVSIILRIQIKLDKQE